MSVIEPEPGWELRVEPCEAGTPARRTAIVMKAHVQETFEVGMYLSDVQIDGLISDLQAAKAGRVRMVIAGDQARGDA